MLQLTQVRFIDPSTIPPKRAKSSVLVGQVIADLEKSPKKAVQYTVPNIKKWTSYQLGKALAKRIKNVQVSQHGDQLYIRVAQPNK
jgi:hypothetical protein